MLSVILLYKEALILKEYILLYIKEVVSRSLYFGCRLLGRTTLFSLCDSFFSLIKIKIKWKNIVEKIECNQSYTNLDRVIFNAMYGPISVLFMLWFSTYILYYQFFFFFLTLKKWCIDNNVKTCWACLDSWHISWMHKLNMCRFVVFSYVLIIWMHAVTRNKWVSCSFQYAFLEEPKAKGFIGGKVDMSCREDVDLFTLIKMSYA